MIPWKNSIAARILQVVLGLYIIIAFVISAGQLWINFSHHKVEIKQNISDVENTFMDGLAVSLWNMDKESLAASVEGILKLPTVSGIRILNEEGVPIAIGGIVKKAGKTGNVGLHIDLLGLSQEERTIHEDEQSLFELIEYKFSITRIIGGVSTIQGQVNVYSSSAIIYQHMISELVIIAASIGLVLLFFYMALLWTVNRYLRRPLGILTQATAGISISNLGDFSVDTGVNDHNEIKQLEETMVKMVNDLHAAVKKQKSGEEQLRAVINSTPGVTYRCACDEHWTMEFISDAVETLTSYPASDFINNRVRSYASIIHPDDVQMVDNVVHNRLSLNEPYSIEYRIVDADDAILWVYERGQGGLSKDGELDHLDGVIVDVTERKRAEEELKQLRNYLSNIIDSMPSILIGVDQEGVVTQWNSEAHKQVGIASDQAVGQPLEKVYPLMAAEIERVQEVISSQKEHCDLRRFRKEGSEVRYEDLTVFPLVANGVEGAVIRIDDITERVRIEEMIVQSEKMMSVGGLAAGMAHEINNPLAGMMQTAQNISSRLTDSSMPANIHVAEEVGITMDAINHYMEKRKIFDMLNRIHESGKRATNIVKNMLSFARKNDDVLAFNGIPEIIGKCIELCSIDYDLKKKYDFRDIEINCEYEDDLPKVPCEAGQIQQVIMNILKNGAEAMVESDRKSSFILRLFHEESAGFLRIEIQDNGPGMSEEVLKRVFEPFFTTKGSEKGTGLGLSVSYFIISENHNGQMFVNSEQGKGTTFTIRLPVNKKVGM